MGNATRAVSECGRNGGLGTALRLSRLSTFLKQSETRTDGERESSNSRVHNTRLPRHRCIAKQLSIRVAQSQPLPGCAFAARRARPQPKARQRTMPGSVSLAVTLARSSASALSLPRGARQPSHYILYSSVFLSSVCSFRVRASVRSFAAWLELRAPAAPYISSRRRRHSYRPKLSAAVKCAQTLFSNSPRTSRLYLHTESILSSALVVSCALAG